MKMPSVQLQKQHIQQREYLVQHKKYKLLLQSNIVYQVQKVITTTRSYIGYSSFQVIATKLY